MSFRWSRDTVSQRSEVKGLVDDGISYGSNSDEEEALSYATFQEINQNEEYMVPVVSKSGSKSDSTDETSQQSTIDDSRPNSPWLSNYDGELPQSLDEDGPTSITLWDLTCNVLGFPSGDPCRDHSSQPSKQQDTLKQDSLNSTYSDLRLSMLSNFSTAYNILSISLALQIMSNVYDLSDKARAFCSSSLLAGMIIGQLGGGALGDLIGRHRAMTGVMFLQVFAAFGSAFSCDIKIDFAHDGKIFGSEDNNIFTVLAAWRFILGVGCGGVYPLAATLSAESSASKNDRAKLVALTFSMQGVGYFVVPFFTWLLTFVFDDDSDISWRILLGVGSLPGILLTVLRRTSRRKRQEHVVTNVNTGHDAEKLPLQEIHQRDENVDGDEPTLLEAIRLEENIFKKLLGTAGCWFLFDVLFYGNSLFQTIVLEAIFGGAESISSLALDQTIVASLALPGYFISVIVMGKQTPRYIQIQGFLVMAILYLIIGLTFYSLSSQRVVLLLLYGATFFFSDYGPNTTTFMLPSMTFSPGCRSTMNGISAASGKAGALLGTILFQPAATKFGDDKVMLICSVLSILGMFMTIIGVKPNVGLNSSFSRKRNFNMNANNRHPSAPSLLDYRS